MVADSDRSTFSPLWPPLVSPRGPREIYPRSSLTLHNRGARPRAGLLIGGNMHTILSWGMGVESTAVLVRWLLEPETRSCTLDELLVLTAQTGDEYEDTGVLCERYILRCCGRSESVSSKLPAAVTSKRRASLCWPTADLRVACTWTAPTNFHTSSGLPAPCRSSVGASVLAQVQGLRH